MVLAAADPRSFQILVQILRGGGVAIAPGDTMYGLIGLAPEAAARLRRVKGREEEKPFLQLIGDASWIGRISDVPLPPRLGRFWPGPLTIVFPAHAGGTAAFRVPDNRFLRDLLHALDQPLYSTSVNRAGSPPLKAVQDMRRELEGDVDAIYDAGDQAPGEPSTLVDITRRPFVILRQGAVHLLQEDLLESS
ncbi:MAG: L-threonylcarbamoyladenylate synthase [Spirochaetia bacterium]|jgi:L-threonylcarbamoyladenylate synthase